MNSPKFKVGDKVVRLPKYAKNWLEQSWTVKEVTTFFDGTPAITLEEDAIVGATKYQAEYFELEYVINSPLYKALK